MLRFFAPREAAVGIKVDAKSSCRRPTGIVISIQPQGYVPTSPNGEGRRAPRTPSGGPLGVRKVMPIFTYFAITAPALLALLFALSAYLQPAKAPSPTNVLPIGTANAKSGPTARGVAADEASHFRRLKQIPINGIKGPS